MEGIMLEGDLDVVPPSQLGVQLREELDLLHSALGVVAVDKPLQDLYKVIVLEFVVRDKEFIDPVHGVNMLSGLAADYVLMHMRDSLEELAHLLRDTHHLFCQVDLRSLLCNNLLDYPLAQLLLLALA